MAFERWQATAAQMAYEANLLSVAIQRAKNQAAYALFLHLRDIIAMKRRHAKSMAAAAVHWTATAGPDRTTLIQASLSLMGIVRKAEKAKLSQLTQRWGGRARAASQA